MVSENILDENGRIITSKRFEQTSDTPYENKYYFYNYDIRGSVTNILNPNGTRVKGYEYDAFGSLSETGSTSFHNDVTFTGSVRDKATGLQYMNARFYNPTTGRFLSQDTYTGNPYDPWTQHLYAYCGNNPTSMVDPTGHYFLTPNDAKNTAFMNRFNKYRKDLKKNKPTYNYVIYTTGENADFSKQAEYQQRGFEQNGQNVIMQAVNSRKEFSDVWNSIGIVNGMSVHVGTVKILTHSNGRAIMFQDETQTEAYSVNGKNYSGNEIGNIQTLPKKNIMCLDLLSCNSGHLDLATAKGGNVAQAFAGHGTITSVYGYDGNVGFGYEGIGQIWTALTGDYFPRQSNEQGSFNGLVLDNYGITGREPAGRVAYYGDGTYRIIGGY